MPNLLSTIARDLSIEPYYGESDSDYCYRVCYSALALSLLYSARSVDSGRMGITKKAQTERVQRVLNEYCKHLGLNADRLIVKSNNFIAHCRKVYEETGYLFPDANGWEVIASNGRTVPVGAGHLYFGIPNDISFALGLGFYTNSPLNETPLFEVFLRDTLTSDEYLAGLYNPLDFEYRDIDQSELEFFNPSLKKPPSSSWGAEMLTKQTVARSITSRTMYRVICDDDGKLLFSDISTLPEKGSLTSYETRRLLFALKEQYGEPVIAWFYRIDENYYEIKLSAHLPTREYYFLLLCAWPQNNAFNQIRYITTAETIQTTEMMLHNIGVRIIWGNKHV